MAKNIDQVYATNPATSLNGADLIYLGQSGVDSAIQVTNIYNTTNLQLSAGKLNTIQDITISSNVRFAAIRLTTGATNGYILQSDASGNGTWASLSTLAVTSIAGTANQIVASAGTGAVTLSLANPLTTPGNVTVTGTLQNNGNFTKFGSLAAFSNVASHEFVHVDSVGCFINIWLTGSMTRLSGTGSQAAINVQNSFSSTSSITIIDGIMCNITNSVSANIPQTNSFRAIPTFSAGGGLTVTAYAGFRAAVASFGGFTGTLTNHYGFYNEALTNGTNRYGAYFNAPTGGTIAIAAYADNISIGYNVTPPTLGMQVSGQASFGASSIGAAVGLQVSYTNASQIAVNGTLTTKTTIITANDQAAMRIDTQLNPTAGTAGLVGGIINLVSFVAPTATSIGTAAAYVASYTAGSNVGTLTNLIGYYANGGLASAGTVTNHYSAYFGNPGFGSTRIALYAANMSIGYLATTPPTDGALIAGAVGIGTTSVVSNTSLTVTIASANYAGIYINGTSTGVSSSNQFAVVIVPSMQPTNGGSIVAGLFLQPAIVALSTKTISTAAAIFANADMSANVATITTFAQVYINGATCTGTLGAAYGLYVNAQSGASKNICASFLEGITIGGSYGATVPPANGAIIQGVVNIGTSTSTTGAALKVSGPIYQANGTLGLPVAAGSASISAQEGLVLYRDANNEQALGVDSSGNLWISCARSNNGIKLYTGATPSAALYVDSGGGISVGNSYTGTTPPSNGLIMQGQALFATTSSTYGASLEVGGSARISLAIVGTKTSTDGAAQNGIIVNPTFAPTVNTTYIAAHIIYNQVNPPTGVTIAGAYGLRLQTGAQGGLGSVTLGSNLLVEMAAYGTTKYNSMFINESSSAGTNLFQTSNASSVNASALQLVHTRGSFGSPTATQNNDVLGAINFGGYGTSIVAPGAVILGVAAETWSGSTNASDMWFYTTNTGTTSNVETFKLTANGNVVCGGNNGAAIATNATNGFLYLPSCAGTPTGVPTAYTGRNAFVYDTSANKLWVYNGSWRGVVVA